MKGRRGMGNEKRIYHGKEWMVGIRGRKERRVSRLGRGVRKGIKYRRGSQ